METIRELQQQDRHRTCSCGACATWRHTSDPLSALCDDLRQLLLSEGDPEADFERIEQKGVSEMYKYDGTKKLAILTDGVEIHDVSTVLWSEEVQQSMQRHAEESTCGNLYYIFRSLDTLLAEDR